MTPREKVYNLRPSMVNPINEDLFMDEEYSDMDSVFGDSQERFITGSLNNLFTGDHRNLDIPDDMILERDRIHSLTQYLDIELPPGMRHDQDHLYRLPLDVEASLLWSASDPDLLGIRPTMASSRLNRTFEALRRFASSLSRLKIFRSRGR